MKKNIFYMTATDRSVGRSVVLCALFKRQREVNEIFFFIVFIFVLIFILQ